MNVAAKRKLPCCGVNVKARTLSLSNLEVTAYLPNNKNFQHNAISIVAIKTRNIASE